MAEQEERDYLTGLYSRKWLFEDCPVRDRSGRFRMLYMDLDNFKAVNDLYGHDEGDRVLKCVASALSENSAGAYPVRMSGDEFVMMIPGERSREEVTAIYESIVRAISARQTEVPGLSVISVSAGAVRSEDGDGSIQHTLNLADDTMYVAKHAGKRRCVFYRDIREKAELERSIADEAPEAVENDRFDMKLLPLLNMQSGMLEQTLVMVRWVRKDGTVLDSSEYRPILENNGYIRVLDLYLLEKLFQMLSKFWKLTPAGRKVRFSIELSWMHFLDRRLEEKLSELFKKYKVKPNNLDFAVAERALSARDVDRILYGMSKVKELGISFSMKNYGSTFAAIRYLNTLPVTSMRFDSKWLHESLKKSQERKLIKSVIRLTKDAHKQIMALGEISADDRKFLAACGCDAAAPMESIPLYELSDYRHYIKEKIPNTSGVVFDFHGNLLDEGGIYPGTMEGDGVTFGKGVSDLRGAIHFSGGIIGENVVSLPPALFSSNSYTIALWICPEKETNWSSAVYMRYEGGFTSFVPFTNADDGISVFRISVDDEGFFDTSCRAIRLNEWSHLCFTYDVFSESVRYYINGRRAQYHTNMPLQIGCRQVLLAGDPFQRSYEGWLSSLRIYSYALSDSEIGALYQSYLNEPGFCGSQEDYWMDAK